VVRLLVAERDPGRPRSQDVYRAGLVLGARRWKRRDPRKVLRCIADIATGAAEYRATARDRYDRVPSRANVLVQGGLETDPVVSRAAVRLRAAIIASAGRRPVVLAAPWPGGKRWAAAFTHDLDIVAYWPLFTLLRLAELSRKGELGRVARTMLAALSAAGRDPVGQAVRRVLDDERALGVVSTWFVLCGHQPWPPFARGISHTARREPARRASCASSSSATAKSASTAALPRPIGSSSSRSNAVVWSG